MTGNQIKGKGFRGALRYNLAKVAKNTAEVLDSSFVRSSEQAIMKEVQMVRCMRPRLEKYFYHTSINFPPQENISSALMKRIGRDYLEARGFTQHQFIMFRHLDAAHPHLHILVNRIGYDGRVLSDSNDYKRSEHTLRRLETKYNLTRVAPSHQARQRAVTKDEMEMMKRTGRPSAKVKLQQSIRRALTSRPTTEKFIRSLEVNGIKVFFNQATTGYVSGISYELDGFQITGAKLGNDFKWASVVSRIDYQQERDQVLVGDSNTTKSQAFPSLQKAQKTGLSTSTHSLYMEQPENADLSDKTASRALHDLIAPEGSDDYSIQSQKQKKRNRRRRKR